MTTLGITSKSWTNVDQRTSVEPSKNQRTQNVKITAFSKSFTLSNSGPQKIHFCSLGWVTIKQPTSAELILNVNRKQKRTEERVGNACGRISEAIIKNLSWEPFKNSNSVVPAGQLNNNRHCWGFQRAGAWTSRLNYSKNDKGKKRIKSFSTYITKKHLMTSKST